jgi:hypothetical protein
MGTNAPVSRIKAYPNGGFGYVSGWPNDAPARFGRLGYPVGYGYVRA